jgi:hypothetical protein
LDERFDVEGALREILDVLRTHNIPVATASLNVSLLDAPFDDLFPQLTTYKARHFHRATVIDDVPVLFHAQRRYPIHEIVQVLEHEIRPPVEGFAEALRQEYPDLKIGFDSASTTRPPDGPRLLDLHSYRLGVDCRFSDDAHADYNQLELSVWLQQREATAYPQLRAWVGWLVDEESGGDWGLDIVYDETGAFGEYAPYQVDRLQKSLLSYFERFRKEVVRRLSGDLADSR